MPVRRVLARSREQERSLPIFQRTFGDLDMRIRGVAIDTARRIGYLMAPQLDVSTAFVCARG